MYADNLYKFRMRCNLRMGASTMRVAIYTRVSTEDQAKEGFSLDAQLEKLRAYCLARGWDISGEYIDEGYSGRKTRRPAYTKMMENINSWDMLLVLKMDRIHRNSKNFMVMMEDLNKKGKEFVSMMESLDTSTAMGRFVMDIIQRIAQLESEQIGERVYIGMEQKAKVNGGMLGFNIPYGYDYINGQLQINMNEATTVKEMVSWYISAKSIGEITKLLNEAKLPTKKGREWAKKTISAILKNPLYCGYIHWEGYLNKSNHESIITLQEFEKVQDLLLAHGGHRSHFSMK